MEIKILNEDEFKEKKGCSALPERENEKENEKSGDIIVCDDGENINEAEKRRNELILAEEKRVEESKRYEEEQKKLKEEENSFINEKLNALAQDKDKFFAMNKTLITMHEEIKKDMDFYTLKEKDEEEGETYGYRAERYVNQDVKETIKSINKKLERIRETQSDYEKKIELLAEVSSTILSQLYKGVLVPTKISIREDGVYPYHCQSQMDNISVLASLFTYKNQILTKIKEEEKIHILKEIYSGIEQTGIVFQPEYYGYKVTDTYGKEIFFDQPFVFIDHHGERYAAVMELGFITGIRIDRDGSLEFLGLKGDNFIRYQTLMAENGMSIINPDKDKIKNLQEEIRSISKRIGFSSETEDYLTYKFRDIFNYLLERRQKQDVKLKKKLDEVLENIKQKGSKFLILASFAKDDKKQQI